MRNADDIQTLLSENADREGLTRAMRRMATNLGGRLKDLLGDEQFYIVGLANDFRVFPQVIAEQNISHLVGAASLGTVPTDCSGPNGERLFTLKSEIIEDVPKNRVTLVVCVSIASDPNEVAIAISTLTQEFKPSRVIFLTMLANRRVLEEATAKPPLHDPVSFEVVSLENRDVDLCSVRDRVFGVLDNRPRKLAPPMPRWLYNRVCADVSLVSGRLH